MDFLKRQQGGKVMKDSELRMIETMLKKQAKLDEAIMKEYGLKEIDEEKLSFAILDEVGELTHELKANWCWWKKTQAPVDKEKVLGELVDIWHFVLSWQNHFMSGEEGLRKEKVMVENIKQYVWRMKNIKKEFVYVLTDLSSFTDIRVEALIAITEYLGFEVEQVYEAYCSKNKINYQRLKEGY
jgi:dimeric dUTPase (all-alpha-NTP-PPase superfamily)